MADFSVAGIDHVELFVPDRYEAARWYEKALGFRIVPAFAEWADDPRGPLMISSDDGVTKLALFTGEPPGARRNTIGFHRVAFRVNGAGFLAFIGRLEHIRVFAESGEQVTSKNIIDHGKAFSIYFCDPFGHRLEVTTYDCEQIAHALRAARPPC